jgi:hypothetical protein
MYATDRRSETHIYHVFLFIVSGLVHGKAQIKDPFDWLWVQRCGLCNYSKFGGASGDRVIHRFNDGQNIADVMEVDGDEVGYFSRVFIDLVDSLVEIGIAIGLLCQAGVSDANDRCREEVIDNKQVIVGVAAIELTAEVADGLIGKIRFNTEIPGVVRPWILPAVILFVIEHNEPLIFAGHVTKSGPGLTFFLGVNIAIEARVFEGLIEGRKIDLVLQNESHDGFRLGIEENTKLGEHIDEGLGAKNPDVVIDVWDAF